MVNSGKRDCFEDRFKAWVNNKITALIWTIQRNRPKDALSLLRHEFFLDELRHHFVECHAEKRVWRAFQYLQVYLRDYPQFNTKHQMTALNQLGVIYGELGFTKEKICPEVNKGKKRTNDRVIQELLLGYQGINDDHG